MTRRRWLVVAVVAVLLLVTDLGSRAYAERATERSIERDLRGVAAARADIGSFPFLPPLLWAGEISKVVLELDDVTTPSTFVIPALRLDIRGLVLDRSDLLGGHAVIDDVDRVVVEARSEVGPLVTLIGPVDDFVDVSGDVLRQAIGPELMPCAPEVVVEGDVVVLQCESDDLPAIIVEAIGSVDMRRRLLD